MRGGDEPTFRLTKPRYRAARRTASYRAKPLDSKRLPSGAARASGFQGPRTFGAASLSILGHPRLTSGGNGGHDCQTSFGNLTSGDLANNGPRARGNPVQLVSSQQWDTDDWSPPPTGDRIEYLLYTCTSSNPQFKCLDLGGGAWRLVPA